MKVTMKRIVAGITAVLFAGALNAGCYNTYQISKDEFEKLQRAPEDRRATVTDEEGTQVGVGDSTRVFARSVGGRRYPVTPFNFRVTSSQLVASDRDTLLALSEIESYEIDHLSTWQTVGLVSVGAVAAAGVIVAIVLTAGSKTFAEGN